MLLDNFEQVVAAAPMIGELLETCPELKVIVPSREPLRLRAEFEYPIPVEDAETLLRQIMDEGAIAGYQLQDIDVEVYDGKFHPVDSKEIAFVIAARNGFLDAISNAGPQILEPIVSIDVTVPDAVMGDVTGNLAGRRARISGTESLSGGQVTVKADMPLSALSDYHAELKSMTQGQGSFTMEFSHYDPVPRDVQQQLERDFKKKDDD